MLPLILVAVGAYLIGDSVLEDKKYAKGGKTQGYDDKKDESLAMKDGKISKKDLYSTHARRDDARFEERGKMAKGGELSEKNMRATYVKAFGKEYDESNPQPPLPKGKYKPMALWEAYEEALHKLKQDANEEALRKYHKNRMAKGGKLVGKQKNLDVNKNGKLDAEDFKMLRGNKMAKGGEASEKKFNTMMNVGKSKYVINYHNGEKTHKDGSPFYDLATFKNKKDFDARKKALVGEGYKEM